MTELEILNEMVDYYSKDVSRRGYDVNTLQCSYFIKATGAMCAVGRCMLDPERFQEINGPIPVCEIEDLEGCLRPQYRGHPKAFWSMLQTFHDIKQNWELGEGLTEHGIRHLQAIKDGITVGRYPALG